MTKWHRAIERRLGVVFGTYTVDIANRPWLFCDSGSRPLGIVPSLRVGRFGFYFGSAR